MAHDGYDFLVRLGGTAITGRIGSTLDMNWDMIDATTVDSSKNKEYLAGEFGGTVTAEGIIAEGDTYSVTQLKTAGDARTPVACLWGRADDDARRYSCNVYVSNVNIVANKNEPVKYSCTLQITGALAEGTYTTSA
jgi:predicted secreted protein